MTNTTPSKKASTMECETETQGNTLLAALSGEFIFYDHPKFKAILASAESNEYKNIILDFSATTFIDSAALGMLLLLRDLCDRHQKKLTLRHPVGQVQKVFKVAKFNLLFTIEE